MTHTVCGDFNDAFYSLNPSGQKVNNKGMFLAADEKLETVTEGVGASKLAALTNPIQLCQRRPPI